MDHTYGGNTQIVGRLIASCLRVSELKIKKLLKLEQIIIVAK